MAGTAENIQVVSSPKNVSVFDGELSPTDLNFNTTDSVSLQDMIDSELALRIVNGLQDDQEEVKEVVEGDKPNTLVDLSPIRHPKHMTDITPVYETPSEQFIEEERLHTMATLNVFSDTIDLSPDCEQAPAFLQSPDISPQYENVPFDPVDSQQSSPISPTQPHIPSEPTSPLYENVSFKTSDLEEPGAKNLLVKLDSDESPVTEDASDLEPMPLFTQTISSDHEQSPLTEVNPFLPDEILLEENGSPIRTPIAIHPVVNVHIEPPDTSPIYSDDSPDQTVNLINNVGSNSEQTPLVDLEPEPTVENEPEPLVEIKPEPLVEIKPEPLVKTADTVASVDSVDTSVDVANRMREFGVAGVTVSVPQWKTAAESEAEWTTVEDAMKSEESSSDASPLVEEVPPLHSSVSETITSTSSTTKTVKKKKSVENGETTKTKKTKKTKKSEEKENHISVITNGHHSPELKPQAEAEMERRLESPAPVTDDELSNVCVRDLKQSYVREAAKRSTSALKVPSEEPVPSPVSIQELRRSFCDLQKACEAPEPRSIPPPFTTNRSQLKARSLGDLRRLTDSPQCRNIHTGVSVKALAASYWSLVSHEPPSPPILLTPPPNKNVAHTLRKSSFSKFDQLQKKTVLHVRSSDASKIQKQLNQETPEALGGNPTCKSCSKTVFAMEQVKAERSVWHKNCFRCKECSKQLTMDTYQSHEGELFCKPHFKELFKPKAVVDNTEDEPPSDKADLGLEELSALNVKARFQVFEKTGDNAELERSPSTVNVKRSPSILSKLAKFQKKGMDVGVTDEILNGVDYEESSSSEDEAQGEDGQVIKGSKRPERPVSFNKMEDVKRSWETNSGTAKTKEELRAEHKKEISQIRSRLFQGKQGKMKEMYEQAVAESEGNFSSKKDQDIVMSEKARLIKERFERGEVVHSGSEDEDDKKNKNREADDLSVFEAGISKKSRSLFLELDATAAKTSTPVTPPVNALTPKVSEPRKAPQVTRQVSDDIVRCSDHVEDVTISTADVSNRFKFFETYKAPEKERKAFRITPPREGQVKEPSPEQEIYRDPSVVRSEDTAEDETMVKRSQTASRMLSLFRQMEEQKESVPDGPKPLKCFTPPPDYKEGQSESSEEEEEESEEEQESEEDGIIRSSDKIEDESLKQAQNAARAKALREKFEHWEPEKQSVNNAINMLESEQESIESTKSLRARFESLKSEQPTEKKSTPKVNRFVETPAVVVKCLSCDKTVYPLEKVEVDGRIYHANCFRCQQCQTKLRMETYTLNNENLYCLPHFRQLFIAKGNYDEGFGSNQHKSKWENSTAPATNNGTVNGH